MTNTTQRTGAICRNCGHDALYHDKKIPKKLAFLRCLHCSICNPPVMQMTVLYNDDTAGIHTCHAECPCQRGEQPVGDFEGE